MSKLIEFLEQLGQDSQLCRASGEELLLAMNRAGLASAARAAVVASDRRAIEQQTGAGTNVCCVIYSSEENDEDDASAPAPSMRQAA